MAPTKKILIVDDEPQLALAVKIRLQAHGYEVAIAPDGRQALEAVQQHRPDCILLDVLMPVMDGYSCLRQLNATLGRGAIPVIILTSRDRMKDLFELEGIADYVVKPFDHEDLLARLQRVLEGKAKKENGAVSVT